MDLDVCIMSHQKQDPLSYRTNTTAELSPMLGVSVGTTHGGLLVRFL